MKILIAIDNLGRGGRERRMIELIKGLLKTGRFKISVVVFSDRIEYDEIYDLDVNLFSLPRKPKKDPRVFARFYRICKKEQPDVIHTWGDMATIFAIPAAFFMGIKLINGSVVNAPAKTGWMDPEFFRKKLALPFSDTVIGNSQAGLNAFKIPARKARCIHNGFGFNRTLNLQSPEQVRKKFSISSDKVVGMMGAFEDRKDYDSYINAAKLVLDAGYDVCFLAIGDGKNRATIEASVEEKYKKNIIFTGLQKEVESIIQVLDIGILSTNSALHGEGISNAILEYMALGKPVIATDGGGTPEIVLEDETGYLIPNKFPKLMAKCMMFLLDNPLKALEMGSKGKQRVKEYFNLANMTSQYIKVYEAKTHHVQEPLKATLLSQDLIL